jgi:hypothetical protein
MTTYYCYLVEIHVQISYNSKYWIGLIGALLVLYYFPPPELYGLYDMYEIYEIYENYERYGAIGIIVSGDCRQPL